MALTNKQIGNWFKSGQTMHQIAAKIDGQFVNGIPVPSLSTLFKVERIIRQLLIKHK